MADSVLAVRYQFWDMWRRTDTSRPFRRGLPHPASPGECLLFLVQRRCGLYPDFLFNVEIAGCVVDMYSPQRRIVIEIDGSAYHDNDEAKAVDEARDNALRSHGLTVVRIPASWVFKHTEYITTWIDECGTGRPTQSEIGP